jgi:hypothetical protein
VQRLGVQLTAPVQAGPTTQPLSSAN